jgi:hypothetical protein
MKKILFAITVGCATALTAMVATNTTSSAQAVGLTAPTKQITIQGKKPARFNHTTHTAIGLECTTCHHDQKHQPRSAEDIAGLTPEDLRCANCHNKDFENKKLRKPMKIFHARCKTCHKNGYNDKKGPTKCSGCHIKSKKAAAIEGC